MHRLIALLVLAGCAAQSPAPVTGFRDPNAQVYSNAVLDSAKLVGRWTQVAEFADARAPACRRGSAEVSGGAKGLSIAATLCLNGVLTRFSGPLAAVGPGRFAPPQGEVWWVLWADVGYRTLVIGTPSGRFGFILNRDGPLPDDRLRAAREVLEWNGYAPSRLR